MVNDVSNDIRVLCYCVCKNEADVIRETLTSAASWAEKVFVWDNGSDDGTVGEIEKACDENGNVVFMGVDQRYFSKYIRSQLVAQVKDCSRPGDWWCKLDSDEIYFTDPRSYLARVQRGVNTVFAAQVNFQFTDREYAQYREDRAAFLARPVKDRFEYYEWGQIEKRFFRDSRLRRLKKRLGLNPEIHSNIVIPVGHYRYRNPEQIKTRVKTRRDIIDKANVSNFPHEMSDEQYKRYCLRERNPKNRRIYDISDDPLLRTRIVDHEDYIKRGQNETTAPKFKTVPHYQPIPHSVPVEAWLLFLLSRKIWSRFLG